MENHKKLECYYALNWDRDKVDWGSRGVCGKLIGYRFLNKEGIDCSNFVGYYVLLKDQKFVFISNSWIQWEARSSNFSRKPEYLYDMLKEHTKHESLDWNRFSWFGINNSNQNSINTTMLGAPTTPHCIHFILKKLANINECYIYTRTYFDNNAVVVQLYQF